MIKEIRIDSVILENYHYLLISDANRFLIHPNNLYNEIFYYTKHKDVNITNFNRGKLNVNLKFKINSKTRKKYNKIKYDISNSEYFRAIFTSYCEKSAVDREKFIYKKNYNKIKKAIRYKNKIKFKYNGESRILEPYFMTTIELHPFNILYCYSINKKRDVTFHLSRISELEILNETCNRYSAKELMEKKKNYKLYEGDIENENILIKFDKSKVQRFQENSYNRPSNYDKFDFKDVNPKESKSFQKLKKKYHNFNFNNLKLKEDEVLYDINTAKIKIKTYFPQFLDYFEVLYPQDLREHFKERFSRALKKYE